MISVDLVVPYVDSSDLNWQKLFNEYNPHVNEEGVDAANRFRGQGSFFKYFFRCVDKNLFWINKIHLLVQSESQVPYWINRDKVHVVLHKDFIPEEYLPTFNSTTIEMFLWNIPGLSEKFLYANDDIFAIRRLDYYLFFEGDKVKNATSGVKFKNSEVYLWHVLNSYNLAYNKKVEPVEGTIIPSLGHNIRPYLKSMMEKAFYEHEDEIKARLSRFRTKDNINVYFYDHYIIVNRKQAPKVPFVKVCSINSFTEDKYKEMILNSGSGILSIQDTDTDDKSNIYDSYTLKNWFMRHFPDKSKYEV